jgi:hypothetical protein
MCEASAIGPLVPAEAGTQRFGQELDARFRGHERSVYRRQRAKHR